MINFFIAGVQKGGTTALHSVLSAHPELSLSQPKELHFFDDETRDWSRPDYTPLERYFPDNDRRLKGEATPIYTYWPNSLERLQAYNGQAKLIVLLRHPTFRAYSHWRMEVARKSDRLSFKKAIGRKGRARVAAAPGGVHRVFSYVERGFYAWQVERIYSLFSRAQVLFLRTDALWLQPAATVGTIEDFLQVPRILNPAAEYVVPVQSRAAGKLSPAVREKLDTIFASDIERTANLTGLDLGDWLRPDYGEPMPKR